MAMKRNTHMGGGVREERTSPVIVIPNRREDSYTLLGLLRRGGSGTEGGVEAIR